MYRRFFKRVFDFLLSVIAIIVLSPIFLIIAIIVRFKLGRPVLFKQKRPGYKNKIFTIYKFRTMTNEKDANGSLLSDTNRLTKLGRFLRATSLDELPELFNIFKGDMAFVGPRPLAAQYLPFYNKTELRRHEVRPGLTGLAQINGRNNTTWEKRFACDIKYVEKLSFLLDVSIVLNTIIYIIQKKDIGERGIDSPIDFDKYRQSQQYKER